MLNLAGSVVLLLCAFNLLHVGQAHGRSDADDPLMKWLAGLKLRLPEKAITTSGVTFTVSQLLCENASLSGIKSSLDLDSHVPSITSEAAGLGASCRGHYAYSGLLVVSGSGDFTATVQSSQASGASGTLAFPVDDEGVPKEVQLLRCNFAVSFSLKFDNSLLKWILNLVEPLVAGFLRDEINQQVCGLAQQFVASNVTAAVGELNRFMLPRQSLEPPLPAAAASTSGVDRKHAHQPLGSDTGVAKPWHMLRKLEAVGSPEGESGSVDWRKVSALEWNNWIIGSLLGADGLNKLIRYALNNASTLVVPGPATPVLAKLVHGGDADFVFNVSVWLRELSLEGVESIAHISPLAAASSSELEVGIGFGTQQQPALGLQVQLALRVEALDPLGQLPATALEEGVALHLALLGPSLELQLEVLCDEAQWNTKRILAQWYTDASGCARSALKQAPQLRKLDVNFTQLAPGGELKCSFNSSGALEEDIAQFVNLHVKLFNFLYEKYLPGAINRNLGSAKSLDALNAALRRGAGPATCLAPQQALKQAMRKLPAKIGDWREIFGGQVRDAIDNVVDGFIAHNSTRIAAGFEHMPAPLHLRPFEKPGLESSIDVAASLSEVNLTGFDQISSLRLLEPSSKDPKELSINLTTDCPAPSRPWSPEARLYGSIAVGGGESASRGGLLLSPPCGSFALSMEAEVSTATLLGTPLPPRPLCLLAALSSATVLQVTAPRDLTFGDLALLLPGQPPQHLLSEVCQMHPSLCSLLGSRSASATSPSTLTQGLAVLLNYSQRACQLPAEDAAEALAVVESSAASTPGRISFIACCLLLAVALLSAVGVGAAARGSRLSAGSMACEAWRLRSPYAKCSAATTTVILAAALVLRVAAIFCLPVASVDATLGSTWLREEKLELEFISFQFFDLVSHFWESSAYACAILLLLSSLVFAHAVVLLQWVLWMTRLCSGQRPLLLRALLFFGRYPLIDVAFFSLALASLNNDVRLPAEATVQLRNNLKSGVYLGVLSIGFAQVGSMRMLLQEKAKLAVAELTSSGRQGQVQVPGTPALRRRQASRWVHVAMAGSAVLGLLLWLIFDFLRVHMTEVAGSLIPTHDITGLQLLAAVFAGDKLLFVALLGTSILAPILQASGRLLQSLGFGSKSCGVGRMLVEMGDGFTMLEIFSGVILFAYVPEIDGFARWIARNSFQDLCDAFVITLGVDCLGFTPAVDWLGMLGLLLLTASSLAMLLSHALQDVKHHRSQRAAVAEASRPPLLLDSPAQLTTSESRLQPLRCGELAARAAGQAK